MIVRGGTSWRTALRLTFTRNKAAIFVVLAIEAAAWTLHELVPELQSTAFSAGAVGVFATVVGIFIAFRFNEAYNRWWEARILWGGMVNASRTFGRQVTTLLTQDRLATVDTDSEVCDVHRELLYRQLAYVNALRLQLRDQPLFPEIDVYLDATESQELRSAKNVATQLNQRQARRLASLLDSDPAPTLILTQIDSTLVQMTELEGGMERINNTAFPDRVIFITSVLVWAVAILVAVAFIEPERGVAWFEFLAVLVVVVSFFSVKQLGEELNDPFDNHSNDTPMTALCRTIEIDLRQQLGETDVPEPLQPIDGILM